MTEWREGDEPRIIRRAARPARATAPVSPVPCAAQRQEDHPAQTAPDQSQAQLECDKTMAAQFLTLLDESAETFTFQTFTDAKPQPRPDPLVECRTGTLEELWPWLTKQNRLGAGVFVTVNETDGHGRKASNITRARAVWQEDDGNGKPLPLDPHIVVESSRGKFHRYFLCDGLSTDDHGRVQRLLVANYGSDPNAADLSRVLRLPGLLHRKGEPQLVRIIHENGAQPYDAATILAAFPPPSGSAAPQTTANASTATEHVTPEQVADLRSALNFTRADARHDWITNGCRLRSLGNVGRELWITWAKQSPKWKPSDAQEWDSLGHDHTGYAAIFADAQARGWVNPRGGSAQGVTPRLAASRPVVTFRTARELLTAPAPIPWLIQNYFARNTLAALIGASGCGKTFLAIDLACCVATGKPWAGQPVAQGAVFFIAGEGQAGIGRRLAAWESATKTKLADSPLFVSAGAVMLDNQANADAVHVECARLAQEHNTRPILIVVDTLARNYGGEENSATDMGKFISNLDAALREPWGACVLVAHHVGLSDGAQTRARGSSALRGALDTEFFVKKTGAQLTLECTKAKDWEPPTSTTAELRRIELPWSASDGEPESSCVLDTGAATIVANVKGATEKQRRALGVLRGLYVAKREQLSRDGCPPDAARVTEEEFRDALEEKQVITEGKTVARHQWRDLRGQLAGRSMVRFEGNCIYPVHIGV